MRQSRSFEERLLTSKRKGMFKKACPHGGKGRTIAIGEKGKVRSKRDKNWIS